MHNSFYPQSSREDNVVIAHSDGARRHSIGKARLIFVERARDTRSNVETRLATLGTQPTRQLVATRTL
jgi:hypothetical protein